MRRSSVFINFITSYYRARKLSSPRLGSVSSKLIHIDTTAASVTRGVKGNEDDFLSNFSSDQDDARFEVLGTSQTLLSISLSASQNLYTRRGTLIGISGKLQNIRSKISILEPFRRSLLRIPFLYQNVSSTTPITALISVGSPITSFAVLKLNGTIDWMIAQPNSLVAWTGQSLSMTPVLQRGLGISRWGNTKITGRGLIALSGTGNIYQIHLRANEDYIAHPGNVIAYTVTQNLPQSYHLSNFQFQIPIANGGLSVWKSDTKIFQYIRNSKIWGILKKAVAVLRAQAFRTVWGDQIFLKFAGPATILMSSRSARVRDLLTVREFDRIDEDKSDSICCNSSSTEETNCNSVRNLPVVRAQRISNQPADHEVR